MDFFDFFILYVSSSSSRTCCNVEGKIRKFFAFLFNFPFFLSMSEFWTVMSIFANNFHFLSFRTDSTVAWLSHVGVHRPTWQWLQRGTKRSRLSRTSGQFWWSRSTFPPSSAARTRPGAESSLWWSWHDIHDWLTSTEKWVYENRWEIV